MLQANQHDLMIFRLLTLTGTKSQVKELHASSYCSSGVPHYMFACRYYKLSMPWLSVTDLDIIKHIHVKEFDCFTDRPVSELIYSLRVYPQDH